MKSSEYHAMHIVLRYIDYYSKIISISGHRRHYRVMEFAWTRTEQFSSMDIRTDIVPVCFVENALLPWKRMIPGRFSALPFDLRQQANVFVHPCILNLSTFSSVFLFFFFFFEPPPRVLFDRLIAGYGKKCAKVLIFDKRSRGIWTVGAARRARLPICGPTLIYSLIYSDFCVLCASCRSFPPFLLSSLSSVILNIEFVWNCSNNDTRVTYI